MVLLLHFAFLANDLWDHKDTWNRSSLWLAPLLSRLWLQALAQHIWLWWIQEVFKGKNIDEEFFQFESGVSHYHFARKNPSRNDWLYIFAPWQKWSLWTIVSTRNKKVRLVKLIVLSWRRRPFREPTLICCLLSDYYLQAHFKKLTFAMK